LGLIMRVGDAAGEGLCMIETSEPCPYGGQADRNGLVADGYCMPADGKLNGGLQVGEILGRNESLSIPDFG